ncbi:metallophosphoesterase [Neobacillus cucumis]|uniref:metallophosphoesterase family protein n=1 Tax=Neobacillus cucumis TaxID=1740721 RepID=UPI0018DFC409|nr:metallophosphoesterase [Neobacillus cucumis]MBI0581075.1 metallophosphoesterase [Neobacillus cucumis]
MILFHRSIKLLKQRIKRLPSQRFNFIFLGDSWVGNDNRIAIFAAILRDTLKFNPLFILHGGDTVFAGGNESEYQQFLNLISNQDPHYPIPGIEKIPMFVVPGNHETNGIGGNLSNFHKYIGPEYWSLNGLLPSRYLTLIGLNNINRRYLTKKEKRKRNLNPDLLYWEYILDSENLTFLRNNLKGNPATTFIAMHVPPYYGSFKKFGPPQEQDIITGTKDTGTFISGWRKMKQIITMCGKCLKAKNLLFSHVHSFDFFKKESGCLEGLTFTLTGGAGARREEPVVPFHYVVITVDNINKKIDYKPIFLEDIEDPT